METTIEGKGIVVIEPSPTLRIILETCLRRAGYQGASFADPVTALRWLARTPTFIPTMAFIELRLPKLDSVELIQYFRRNPAYSAMPIIVLHRPGEGLVPRIYVRLAGANALLEKPFRTQQVLALVTNLWPQARRDETEAAGSISR